MLILLRHGRTQNNAESRLQGSIDPPLDEVGRAQAQRAGAYIRAHFDIDTVVTSSLRRAVETVQHAGFGPTPSEVDDRWREIDFGEFEGRKVHDTVADLGARWHADITYAPAGGESLATLHERVAIASAELMHRTQDETILVVSHATPIKSAVIWATGGTPSMILNLWVGPGNVSVLRNQFGATMLTEFNRRI